MSTGKQNSLVREVFMILAGCLFLALIYNAFSAKGLSIVRTEPVKIAVDDSLLFPRILMPIDSSGNNSTIIPQTNQTVARQPEISSSPKTSEITGKKQVYKVVTLDQVSRLLREGRGLFIDAREQESYRKGHIKGAVNIFGDEPDEHFAELAPLSRDTLVVLYCNGPECHLGRALAEFMSVMEFTNLLLYDDGWEGWQKAKMPEEKSP